MGELREPSGVTPDGSLGPKMLMNLNLNIIGLKSIWQGVGFCLHLASQPYKKAIAHYDRASQKTN